MRLGRFSQLLTHYWSGRRYAVLNFKLSFFLPRYGTSPLLSLVSRDLKGTAASAGLLVQFTGEGHQCR